MILIIFFCKTLNSSYFDTNLIIDILLMYFVSNYFIINTLKFIRILHNYFLEFYELRGFDTMIFCLCLMKQ